VGQLETGHAYRIASRLSFPQAESVQNSKSRPHDAAAWRAVAILPHECRRWSAPFAVRMKAHGLGMARARPVQGDDLVPGARVANCCDSSARPNSKREVAMAMRHGLWFSAVFVVMSGACSGQERTPTEPTTEYMQPSGDQAPTADAGIEGGNMQGGWLDEEEKNAPAMMGAGTVMGPTGAGGTSSSTPGALEARTSRGTTSNTGIGGSTTTGGSPSAVGGSTGVGGTRM
jgi:hypothetical protein